MNVLHSMTGFGAASAERGGLLARVEIRTVNHRGRKVSVRSRPGLGTFEKNVRDQVQERLHRGAVDIYVTLTRPVDESNLPVREPLARGMVAALQRLGTELGLDTNLSVRDLLLVPGLFDESAWVPVTEDEWPTVSEALAQALEQVLGMRRSEGEATARSLQKLTEPIAAFANEARGLVDELVERQRERLRARVREICKSGMRPLDEQAVEREVCLYADRSDIHEELDRLESHVGQFATTLQRGGEVGKRLEFLAQEFLRELNTCVSKVGDTGLIGSAVEAKAAVEKLKEQVANIE